MNLRSCSRKNSHHILSIMYIGISIPFTLCAGFAEFTLCAGFPELPKIKWYNFIVCYFCLKICINIFVILLKKTFQKKNNSNDKVYWLLSLGVCRTSGNPIKSGTFRSCNEHWIEKVWQSLFLNKVGQKINLTSIISQTTFSTHHRW